MTVPKADSAVEIARLCELLSLVPHPEGGYYREHYRGAQVHGQSASTSIYFLLGAGDFSAWHRVVHDELWHHYQGAPIELHTLDETVGHRVLRLGPISSADDGTRPCHVVPGGVWQAARPLGPYALIGNTVAPGFEFSEFEIADEAARRRLGSAHPGAVSILSQLSR